MKIKSLLLSLMLLVSPVVAQDFPTNVQPVNITIVIVVGSTNEIPGVLTAVSNMYPMASFYMSNTNALVLAKQIALMQARYNMEYEGVPSTFSGNDKFALNQIEELWKKMKEDKAYIQSKREELKKLYVLPLK